MTRRTTFSFLLLLVGSLFANVWALEPNGDGVYEISSAQDFVDFATLVNGGQYDAKAVMTKDIDMTGADASVFPIGGSDTGVRYVGTFDGQGHKFSNLVLENVETTNYGVFNTGSGVVLRNFYLDATCSITGGELVGLVGRHDGAGEFTNIGNCGAVTGEGNNVAGLIGALWGAGKGTTVETVFNCCWTTGPVTTKEYHAKNTDCGAISGWFNNGKFVLNGCWTMSEVAFPKSEGLYVLRYGGGAAITYDGCYSLHGSQPNFGSLSGLTLDDLSTGAVAYRLNGDQSVIRWYQTLGEDLMPVTDATHKQVYLTTDRRCDGLPKGDAVYSNSPGGTQDAHHFVDGFCTGCGLFDATFMAPDAEGWYTIQNGTQLKWFALKANRGNTDGAGDQFYARLTADIDMTGVEGWEPIGTAAVPYKGTFDGQGHAITGFHMTAVADYGGLFGQVVDATVANFSIAGKLVCAGNANGAVAYASNSTLSNIHSLLEVDAMAADVKHTGGVVGEAWNSTHVVRCAFSGTLEVGSSNHDCFGGVCGYTDTGWFDNCANYGRVAFLRSNCYAGGILGYVNNTSTKGLHNCLGVGEVVFMGEGSPDYGGALVGRLRSYTASNFGTNYWLEGSAPGATGDSSLGKVVAVTAEQLADGSIAWVLNGKSFLDPVWFQTIGTDATPLLAQDHAVVYANDKGYAHVDPADENTYYTFRAYMMDRETRYLEEVVAAQEDVDAYQAVVDFWETIESFGDFCESYVATADVRNAVKASADAYKAYIEACENAIKYMDENGLTGAGRHVLETYLETKAEPSEDYPNGTYLYIIEARALNTEAVTAETAFVNALLEQAIAANIVAGTEVTKLMVNPDFANGFEGWTTTYEGGSITTGGETSLMTLARGLNNTTFDFHQTLTEMPNGIYMVTANGMFRPTSDVTSEFYAGQLYMNGTANYFMAPGEDLVSDEEAQDGVNCHLSDDARYEYADVAGYVPGSLVGCSYAYSAGRYMNYCAVEVKDSTLTVGVRNLGNGLASSWLPFGNLHVYYLGTPDEAAEALAPVLEGFAARATTVINYAWSDGGDYAQFPNISEALKGQLTEAVEAAGAATTGGEKMDLINRFSSLFADVHDCRLAYIQLASVAENMMTYVDNLHTAGLLSDEDSKMWTERTVAAWKAYSDGRVSAQEARELAEELSVIDNVLPMKDGYYQLASTEDVNTFAVLVSCGLKNAKGQLTADVDLSVIEEITPIGIDSHPFSGVFDGQGHKITGFHMSTTTGKTGFFGYVVNAEIRNFSISGTLTCPGGGTGMGVIGWAEGTTISDVHSAVEISVTGDDVHHVGGIVGGLRTGSSIYRSTFSGSLNISANDHDCFGGVVAYTNEYCRIVNCANYGDVTFTSTDGYVGGICGYLNNNSFGALAGCLNMGQVKMADGSKPTYGGAIMGRLRSYPAGTFYSNYWLEGSAAVGTGQTAESSCVAVSAEQLKSGAVCYGLNLGQEQPAWFQTLGEDELPVLDNTHKQVYRAADGTYTNEFVETHEGTEEDPFVVKSAFDLVNLSSQFVAGRMNYVVMEADVDMADVTDWKPLFNYPAATDEFTYPFIDFDGQNHVIRNLTSKTDGAYDYPGLFGVLCGNVRNLGVENADVASTGGTGILAGYLGHSKYGKPCYVENVWVTGKLEATGYCGGMFGNIGGESHITNCYANVEVTGASDLTGGIVGRVRAQLELTNVYAAGTVNRGGGIIGGGHQDATPMGRFTNVAVWNNTEKNFGPTREGDVQSGILYYDGTNFADLQSQVVAWDPAVWSCDMAEGSYPVLKAFTTGIGSISAPARSGDIYDLSGRKLMIAPQKGMYIMNGKKVLVK